MLDDFPSFSRANLTDLFPLFLTEDVDIVIFWEAKEGSVVRRGHNTIPGIRLGTQAWIHVPAISDPSFVSRVTNSLYMETKREKTSLISNLNKNKNTDQSPLKIMLHCKNQAQCDFSSGR